MGERETALAKNLDSSILLNFTKVVRESMHVLLRLHRVELTLKSVILKTFYIERSI
jgi:hypothetical protein